MPEPIRNEERTIPKAEDGAVLEFRPDLGADVYLHPTTGRVYLETGPARYERTAQTVQDLAARSDPAADFPTERPRGVPRYGVDLSAEGYA